MNKPNLVSRLAVITLTFPGISRAIDLQPYTLKAWSDYIASADARMQGRLDGKRPFLWIDEAGRNTRLRPGEPVVSPVFGNGSQTVPGGLIHDWIGAVFIPNVTIEELRAVLGDYDRYKEFYSPVVVESKSLPCPEPDRRFSMIWHHRAFFIEAAIEAQYQSRAFTVDSRRGYSFVTTTQVREIESFGQKGQRFLPPDHGNGFIWRFHSISRYEERDGGVTLELEAMALTRDMPPSLRWLIGPIVSRLSMNSLTNALRQTRDAVQSAPRKSTAAAQNRQ